MKITIESTSQIGEIDGVLVRRWKGRTEGGIECEVFIHRIAVPVDDDCSQFEAELKEHSEPGPDCFVPIRHIP